jgi:Zn-dependent peptidase ImmA (M78 family)
MDVNVEPEEQGFAKVEASGLTKQQVSSLAEGLVRKLNYEQGSDIAEVVKMLGGRLSYKDFWDIGSKESGSIKIHGEGNFDIYIASHTSGERDNFTVAHEIGHYVLHYLWPRKQGKTLKKAYATRYGSDRAEWEANWFAAAFLMPEAAYKKSYQENNGNFVLIASDFGVSPKAAEVRAQALHLI